MIASYVLDGDRPLTADSGGNTTFYLYGLGAIGEKTTDWSISLPDGTNTPRQLANLQGEITISARYTPWGDTLDTYGTGNFSYGYLGGLLDAVTGLLYVGNGQYYDPATGRFLTRDMYPNSPNPYVPWNPLGTILGPLAVVSMLYGRRKTRTKWDAVIVIVLLGVSAGVGLVACAPPPVTPMPGSQPTEAPSNSSPTTPSPALQSVSTEPGTVVSIVPSVTSSPTEIPELGCPAPVSSAQDEEYKRLIEDNFGIIFGGILYGTQEWPSVHIQIVYGALTRVNNMLGGNLRAMLGNRLTVFHHLKNELGDGKYYGYTRSTGSIEFYVVNTFPYHLIYHEMGHLLNNAQGQKYTYSLDHKAVYTDYPNQEGRFAMGRDCPAIGECNNLYSRIDGQGFINTNLHDPCGASVDAELHPASEGGNNAGEEWGDLFANYVAGNFNVVDPIGRAKHDWVKDQLYGS